MFAVHRRSFFSMLLACACACSAPPSSATDGDDSTDAGQNQTGLTWYRDVLPIVQVHCSGCHVEGGIAPFSMSSYAEAAQYHESMASAVSTGQMPPWLPTDNCGDFQGNRRLAQADIDTLVSWANGGAVEGDPADAPPPAPAPDVLTAPDATLQVSDDYTPNQTVSDDYRCFILDPQLTASHDLVAFAVTPGQRAQVHHVLLYSTAAADAKAKDDGEAGLGWTCYGGPPNNSTLLGGWVPGPSDVVRYPATTGIRMAAGRVIVMQVHYNLQNGAKPDRTTVKLQYAASPVQFPALIVPWADQDLNIPPKSNDFVEGSSTSVPPGAKRLWAVLPHMHTKGHEIRVDIAGQCMVDIPKWDFHWQQFYFYNQPVTVSAGQRVDLKCTYDNTTDAMVHWGEGTADEMCLNYFYLTQ